VNAEIELTPRQLRIPLAVAARYARPGTNRYEELVSAGNLGLVEGLRSFDPARGALVPHLFARVRARVGVALGAASSKNGRPVFRHERRWGMFVSLDAPLEGPGGGLSLAGTLEARAEPDLAEIREAVSWVLSRLSPSDRELFVRRHAEGASLRDLAALPGGGRSPAGVAERLRRAERRARDIAANLMRA
jgi:DNA-directed RNA polymerase specialized sigma24 family protein